MYVFKDKAGRTLALRPEVTASVVRAYQNVRGVKKFFVRELTVKEVYSILEKIARVEGENSRLRKIRLLEGLFSSLGDTEIEYLLRFISGEPRIGANVGLLLEALAKLANTDIDTVLRAYMFEGDIGELTKIAVLKGEQGLKQVKLTLFKPVRPMLGEMSYDIREVLKKCGGRAAFEYKYDGIRLQIHKRGNKVRLFTRRLKDVTESLPDVVDLVLNKVKAHEVILDSEAVGFKDGRPIRFQDLVKRIRRKYDVRVMMKEIPLTLRVFDILLLDGKILIDEPYEKRWEILYNIVENDILTRREVLNDLAKIKTFLDESLRLGNEGLMAKRLDSPYVPGTRGRYWFKIKPAETLDLVIVGAEWGHGRRRGWLSDYYLAVYDDENNEFLVIGKTFKGLTDEEFKETTKKLLELKVKDEGWRIWVQPKIVVEVAFNEIQKSPKYKSGFALRFARIVRFRPDKSPYEITTFRELKELYEKQFKVKSKLS